MSGYKRISAPFKYYDASVLMAGNWDYKNETHFHTDRKKNGITQLAVYMIVVSLGSACL